MAVRGFGLSGGYLQALNDFRVGMPAWLSITHLNRSVRCDLSGLATGGGLNRLSVGNSNLKSLGEYPFNGVHLW
jgi:hypothetical protein